MSIHMMGWLSNPRSERPHSLPGIDHYGWSKIMQWPNRNRHNTRTYANQYLRDIHKGLATADAGKVCDYQVWLHSTSPAWWRHILILLTNRYFYPWQIFFSLNSWDPKMNKSSPEPGSLGRVFIIFILRGKRITYIYIYYIYPLTCSQDSQSRRLE